MSHFTQVQLFPVIKAVERELLDCLYTLLALLLLWIILLENILVMMAVCHIVQENFFLGGQWI